MESKKGNQGPKSPEGKKRSAKNSTKHGLSSQKLTTVEQRRSYDKFLQELIQEYQLRSPLELFQAQRLALYKVKLEESYSLEQTYLEFERELIRNNFKSHIADYKFLEPVVVGMLSELFQHKNLLLPCRLTPEILNQICLEIDQFVGEVHTEKTFKEYFSCLSLYLERYVFSRDVDLMYKRLEVVSNQIHNTLNRGQLYVEYLKQYVAEPDDQKHHRMEADEEMNELELFLIQQKLECNKNKIAPITYPEPKPYPNHEQLYAWMKPFLLLRECYNKARIYEVKILEKIELKLSKVELSEAQLARLMKYQQIWEKRYSDGMAELMALLRERTRGLA